MRPMMEAGVKSEERTADGRERQGQGRQPGISRLGMEEKCARAGMG